MSARTAIGEYRMELDGQKKKFPRVIVNASEREESGLDEIVE